MALYALIQDYVVVKIDDLTEDQVQSLGYQYQNIVDAGSSAVGWKFDGRNLIAPTPLTPDQYVAQVVIPSAKAFAIQLETTFIKENILMGISQYGKTAAVLGVLTKKVTVSGSPEPVSLVDTLHAECPSLTVTLQVLSDHITNVSDYSSLSPFITRDRLVALYNSIANYLHVSTIS